MGINIPMGREEKFIKFYAAQILRYAISIITTRHHSVGSNFPKKYQAIAIFRVAKKLRTRNIRIFTPFYFIWEAFLGVAPKEYIEFFETDQNEFREEGVERWRRGRAGVFFAPRIKKLAQCMSRATSEAMIFGLRRLAFWVSRAGKHTKHCKRRVTKPTECSILRGIFASSWVGPELYTQYNIQMIKFPA